MMIKAVAAGEMSDLEQKAYQQGCQEAEFMAQAGKGVAEAAKRFIEEFKLPHSVILLCGKGNNGGDAFVAGIHLLGSGYAVYAIHLERPEKCSPLCRTNRLRFEQKGGICVDDFTECAYPGLILDGIFGTGFKGAVQEPYFRLIQEANESRFPIMSIDVPSGLNGTTGEAGSETIEAVATVYLGLPKTGLFLRDGWNVCGKLIGVDFGLPEKIVEKAASPFEVMEESAASRWLPPILRNRNKYQAGLVIGLAGSPTMSGAALLASTASLKGGCGMVRLFYPSGMETELAASPYELIKIPFAFERPNEILAAFDKAKAAFIGPGLGRSDQMGRLLKEVVPQIPVPSVLDADALFFLGEGAFSLPKGAVLTPHFGEMQRLLKATEPLVLDEKLLESCQEYVEKNKVTLVLKGAPTFIFHPGRPPLASPVGDPGMATAGTGDVLTGLIAALLAQGLAAREAAALGVYLHGIAGECAAGDKTSYCMVASDLINHFPDAFRSI